jgi:hypothetical protein
MKISREDFEKAVVVAERIKNELEPLILGKRFPAWKCCCGVISRSEAEAVAVERAGLPPYADQIALWYMWGVEMRPISGEGHSYVLGLEQFIPREQLEEGFKRHFAGVNVPLK